MLIRVASVLPPELDDLVHKTIGCALEVHRTLGAGYLESIYHKAMRIELQHQRLKHESERSVTVYYRGQALHNQRIDLIVEKQVVVEIKSVERLEQVHKSQVVSYLRATNLRVGLLINFNTDWLKSSIRRVVL